MRRGKSPPKRKSRARPVALLSVFEKKGIVEFAQALRKRGFRIIASGGTRKKLREGGVPVVDVARFTKLKAVLDHMVVTLSGPIHGGLLADFLKHVDEMERLGWPYIHLVCVDLYPLKAEIAKPDSTDESVRQQTDIGGPTMLRSGAKGKRRIVICDPADRQKVIDWIDAGRPDEEEFLRGLAAKAEGVVADYALSSARHKSKGAIEGMVGRRVRVCRYGENPQHGNSGLFALDTDDPLAIPRFEVEVGEPGFVNWTDVDRLLMTLTHTAAVFDLNRGVVLRIALAVKHGNLCGGGVAGSPKEAICKMIEGDPLSILGGFVMLNFDLAEEAAETLMTHALLRGEKRRVLDGFVAPGITEGAMDMLKRRGDRCKIITNEALRDVNIQSLDTTLRIRPVRGGFLTQDNYRYVTDLTDEHLEKLGQVPQALEDDLLFASAIGRTQNSNTMVLVCDGRLIANGVGQQSRVHAARLALMRARWSHHDPTGAGVYSDSYCPKPDAPRALVRAGVGAILSSSGSTIGDKAMRKMCADSGVPLYLIPDKEGRGFAWH